MKKILTAGIIILLGILLMYTTKPTSKDFDDYIEEKFDNIDHNEKTNIQRLINTGIEKTIIFQIKQTKEFEDKVLFVLVNAKELDEEVRFLGIMGMWFSLS